MKKIVLLVILTAVANCGAGLESVYFDGEDSLVITACHINGERIDLNQNLSLFSAEIDDSLYHRLRFESTNGDSFRCRLHNVSVTIYPQPDTRPGICYRVILKNTSDDEVKIANVVPFGQGSGRAFITGHGSFDRKNYLSRTVLFTPDLSPVGVVMPDNAWEAGFCDIAITEDYSLVALVRRSSWEKAERRRWWTLLKPKGRVEYVFYLDSHEGRDWRTGLKMMFHDRRLYDMDHFDRRLYDRRDLRWIRDDYLMLLQMAWDKTYYDALRQEHVWYDFLTRYDRLWGNVDIYVLWPTWPRLGLDERNQWDLYGDLPGGLQELRRQVGFAHSMDTRYFISYNPWDIATRGEDHLLGMQRLLRRTGADGVVLDTRGESSRELQQAADEVKPGIIMYSEGMPVPKHMPTIVTGRVHDAIYLPPPLNLNKYIFPENQIFRVLQLSEGRLHREAALCLFNGYGMELNVMRAGRPPWMLEEFAYMGRALRILRDNSKLFSMSDYQPLVAVNADSLWVNKWENSDKCIYTVYSLIPQGFSAPLIETTCERPGHFVGLWHHEEIKSEQAGEKAVVTVNTGAFDRRWLGTRREGTVDCIAWFPQLIKSALCGDSLALSASAGNRVAVWPGNPSYDRKVAEFDVGERTIAVHDYFAGYAGKIVIQLFDDDELIDEAIVRIPLATPRLLSQRQPAESLHTAPPGMVKIPGGEYLFRMSETQEPNIVLQYPDLQTPRRIHIQPFYMDRYPVTNRQYQLFLQESGYVPEDTVNFLRHWHQGSPPDDLLDHPVVNISLADARAYAARAGKRLPTGIEWQYAAQGTDGRRYPWGDEMDSTLCNYKSGCTTPVDAFPGGAGPFGVMDMVGNVWQLTDDLYDNGAYYFVMMRGGSYYHTDAGMWYIRGGPWPVDQHKLLLLVSDGFDRNATVGFRCVKDMGDGK
jgi:formylglycine-generating enzyme required for sulfatase activity